jgi:hypothetical protein
MTGAMDRARAVADAVLYEGYLLYPYRASSAKNKVRWQWGVLMPPAYADAGIGEYATSRTELLAEPERDSTLHVRLRLLQLQTRTVEVADGDSWRAVPSVVVAGTEYTTWDEAVEREVDTVVRFADLVGADTLVPFDVDGGEEVEPIPGDASVRVVRRRRTLHGTLWLRADDLPGPYGGVRLRVRVENTSPWGDPEATRDDALTRALIAAHTLLALSHGKFLSQVEPPEWAAQASAECRNERAWPILIGEPGRGDTVLCSPIILYDYPVIAQESTGNFFDGTEIDEILTLRTMTLTDEEKREARATDPRAADLIDRVDTMPQELLDRLHGTVRYLRAMTTTGDAADPAAVTEPPDVPWWDPGSDSSVSPETDTVVIDGVAVGRGTRVRLRPGKRADAHDMFLVGRVAVVQAVLLDVDDNWHLAVTIEDDPGADLYAAHGRYRYFGTDEVEPLPPVELLPPAESQTLVQPLSPVGLSLVSPPSPVPPLPQVSSLSPVGVSPVSPIEVSPVELSSQVEGLSPVESSPPSVAVEEPS